MAQETPFDANINWDLLDQIQREAADRATGWHLGHSYAGGTDNLVSLNTGNIPQLGFKTDRVVIGDGSFTEHDPTDPNYSFRYSRNPDGTTHAVRFREDNSLDPWMFAPFAAAGIGALAAGAAGAGAGAGSAATAGGAAEAAGAAGLGSLGSGTFGAVGAGGLGELGAVGSLGLEGLGAGAGAAGFGGMSAAEMLAAAYPMVEGAGAALGSGMFGTGIADIGGLMGTMGGDFAMGTGLGGVDLGSVIGGDFLQLGGSGLDNFIGGDTVGGMDPYANETAKLARQNAQEPGAFWEENMTVPTHDLSGPSWLERQLQNQGERMLKQQIKNLLMPEPQQQMGGMNQGGLQRPNPVAPVFTGAPSSTPFVGSSSSQGAAPVNPFAQDIASGSPFDQDVNQELAAELRDRRYDDSGNALNFQPMTGLQTGNNDATLAGYELWKALNQQNS